MHRYHWAEVDKLNSIRATAQVMSYFFPKEMFFNEE
jgi:hypothetical protein